MPGDSGVEPAPAVEVHLRPQPIGPGREGRRQAVDGGCRVHPAVETLNVAGMIRNRRLARAIADAAMAGFLAKLEYKCAWYGAEHVKADR